ncbi:hypothetical protein [Streptomyces sp. DH10]|uniref:hypothetical protein n=1 Tax=Streptomyces sp. DH10 TaxID=3040121 RepID=UPI002440F0C6|nr:hypothetical protein [Streptomyces sp. DH10]MDG9711145.1 hypothetical protein [Streptomyces sp. DH10]
MAKPKKQKTDPQNLAAAIGEQGYRVEKRTHGWLCFPEDKTQPAEWISRNVGGRGQKNNEAVAKRFGVDI